MVIPIKQLTLSIFLAVCEMFVQPQEIINKYIEVQCFSLGKEKKQANQATHSDSNEYVSVCVCV